MALVYQECSIVILVHPRCGSASLASAFQEVGIQLGHERLLRDGIVSWWHVAFFMHREGKESLFYPSSKGAPAISAKEVMYYVRKPSDALPSIVLENENDGRNNNSFRLRSRVIWKRFSVDITQLAPLPAAVASYYFWNKLSRDFSSLRDPIKIEKPYENKFANDNGIRVLPVRNKSINKFKLAKAETKLEDFLDRTSPEIADQIMRIETNY